jgi:hypothetical protein
VSRSTPPSTNEFEISVIGPGRGECVLLHLGDNEWCVVDSCTARGRTESVAIEYLNSFENGALDGVKIVVATHWHDDHIRGLASVLRRVPSASFFCSAALDKEIFFELVGITANGIQGRSGVDEFAAILGLIGDSAAEKTLRLATPKWAIENRKLLDLIGVDRTFSATVTALSPSDGTLALAYTEIAQVLPKTGDIQRRITNLSPNHTSVVLWVEAGPMRALLGADLLHTGHAGEGWGAVLSCKRDETAAFFKVPHHGSANADCPEVWDQMLRENPIAVVTPFTSGVPLPKSSDLLRLAGRTTNCYCTTAGAGKAPSRDAVVEKTMRRQVTERRVVEGAPGHVRVRWSLTDQMANPVVELFNGAHPVTIDARATL